MRYFGMTNLPALTRATLALTLLLAGCATTPAPRVATAPTAHAPWSETRDQILRELAAADPRFARRARLQPTQAELAAALQASIATEEQAGVLNGGPDAFTRAPRERALQRAATRLASTPAPGSAEDAREQAGLRILLLEERTRFARETPLPRAATRLIRALAQLDPPQSMIELQRTDATVSRHLGDIEDSLDEGDSLDCDAIEDALDELEPLLGATYTDSEKALASLRLACDQTKPPARGARALPPLSTAVPSDAKGQWVELRDRVKGELRAYQTPAESVRESEREADAAGLLFGRTTCAATRWPGQVAAPPERAFGCAALQHAAEQPLLTSLMVHDLLTLGLWATELAEQREDYRRVLTRYAMASRVSPDVGSRIARRAAAEPELALRAGMLGAELAKRAPNERPGFIRDYLARGAFLPSELAGP